MGTRQLSTFDYPLEARERLADAVTKAREAVGWKSRAELARRASVSLRRIVSLENPDEGIAVGRRVLHAVGRALPSWTADTPKIILEGGPIPTTLEVQPPEPDDVNEDMLADYHAWHRRLDEDGATEEDREIAVAMLGRLWAVRERDAGRRARTLERFMAEVEAEPSRTERDRAQRARSRPPSVG